MFLLFYERKNNNKVKIEAKKKKMGNSKRTRAIMAEFQNRVVEN